MGWGSLDIGEGEVDVGKSNIVYGSDCVGERLRCRWSPKGTCSKLKSGKELERLPKLASTSSRKVLGEESELRMVLRVDGAIFALKPPHEWAPK